MIVINANYQVLMSLAKPKSCLKRHVKYYTAHIQLFYWKWSNDVMYLYVCLCSVYPACYACSIVEITISIVCAMWSLHCMMCVRMCIRCT